MIEPCPSDLQLEAHLLAAGASPVASHVEGCARCRGRLARMEREGREFQQVVYPATVGRIRDAADRRGRWPRWAAVAVPVSALAAALLLTVADRSRLPGDYVGVKGGLGFAAYVERPAGAAAVADGARVPAGAALRFAVRPPRPCRLWLASIDAAGEVSRLYPAAGEPPVAKAGALPGGVVLDGRAGPERIYAVCAPGPLPFSELARAIRRAAAGGEAAVRAAGPLRGLPGGSAQESLLLEKSP